jgi:hypothetical protein
MWLLITNALCSPEHDVDNGRGTHTFVSFTYSERTGVYMSMYYSTKIFGVYVENDRWAGYDRVFDARHKL